MFSRRHLASAPRHSPAPPASEYVSSLVFTRAQRGVAAPPKGQEKLAAESIHVQVRLGKSHAFVLLH